MKTLKQFTTVMLAAAMCASLAACGGTSSSSTASTASGTSSQSSSSSSAATPQAGGTFTYVAGSMDNLFAPTSKVNTYNFVTWPAIEPLARFNSSTGEVDYKLATDMQYDKETNTMTIKLRQGVKFTDGSDFNADVVVWLLQLYIDNNNASKIANPTGFSKIDDYTVQVTFDSYNYSILSTYGDLGMYSKEAYEKNGAEWCQTNLVGTGPYILDEYVLDSSMHYTKNPDYWGTTYLDEINILSISDKTTKLSAFENEEVDYILVSGDEHTIDQLLSEGYENVNENTGAIFNMLFAKTIDSSDPFSNLKVRQAVFRYAIDWEGVGNACSGKYAMTSGQFADPSWLCYNSEIPAFSYDTAKAKELLAEAGYPDGFSTKIYTTSGNTTKAAAIQDALKDVGIEVEVVTVNNINDAKNEGLAGLYIANRSCSTQDMSGTHIHQLYPGYSYDNLIKFSDEYIKIGEQIEVTSDAKERAELVKQADKLVVLDDCLFTPMYYYSEYVFVNHKVQGYGDATKYSVFLDPTKIWVTE